LRHVFHAFGQGRHAVEVRPDADVIDAGNTRHVVEVIHED
jgi:hypothetical protein